MTRSTYLSNLFLATILLVLAYVFVWSSEERAYRILSSDGRGYYAYLPSFIIYGETNFESSLAAEEERLPHWSTHTYLYEGENGRSYNKYFPGVAILVLPFFLLSFIISWLVGSGLSGYEDVFLIGFHVATISYTIFGYELLRRIVMSVVNKESLSIFIALLVVFGTNLFYYAGPSASLSHCYSFFAIALVMYLALTIKANTSLGNIVALLSALMLTVLIRPTNALSLLLVPVMLGSHSRVSEVLMLMWKRRWIIGGISLLLLSILPLLNFVQSGNLFNWSYEGEGFNFSRPALYSVLFSIRKGWFVWTPIAFIAIFGLVPMYRANRFSFGWIIAFLLLNTYVIASWWNWYYGGGFGHRAFVDSYAVIGLLLAYLFAGTGWAKVRAIAVVLILLGAFNVLQAAQTLAGILPKDVLTPSMYWSSLTAWSSQDVGRFHGVDDIRPFGKEVASQQYSLSDGEVVFGKDSEFGMTNKLRWPVKNDHQRHFIAVELEVMKTSNHDMAEAYLIIETKSDENELIGYKPIPLYEDRTQVAGEWHKLQFNYKPIKESEARLNIYVWNKGGSSFKIRNAAAEVSLIEF